MDDVPYHYTTFEFHTEEFDNFSAAAPKSTMRAPNFPLEDLTSGTIIEMKELWKTGMAVVEFGSFS